MAPAPSPQSRDVHRVCVVDRFVAPAADDSRGRWGNQVERHGNMAAGPWPTEPRSASKIGHEAASVMMSVAWTGSILAIAATTRSAALSSRRARW